MAAASTPIKDFFSSFMLHRAAQGHGADRPVLSVAQDHGAVSRRRRRRCRRASAACTRCAATRTAKSAASPASCARRCARRWRSPSSRDVRDDGIAPHHALRHRPDQVHLLRLLRRELPGRLDRRDPHLRIPRRKARRPVLHQGHAAGRGRPLREPRSRPARRPTPSTAERPADTPRCDPHSHGHHHRAFLRLLRRAAVRGASASSRRAIRCMRRCSWCWRSSAPRASGCCCRPSSWRSRWCWSTSAR